MYTPTNLHLDGKFHSTTSIEPLLTYQPPNASYISPFGAGFNQIANPILL